MFSRITVANEWIAGKLSDLLSNMWLFWLIVASDVIYVGANPPHNPFEAMLLAYSIFLQSVALVLINNTTMTEGAVTRKLLQETHDTVMEEMKILRERE